MPVRALRQKPLRILVHCTAGKLKTMNAREGIKTNGLKQLCKIANALKTMNAREGIKTPPYRIVANTINCVR